MYRKLIYLISFVLVLGLAAGNQAQAAVETIYSDNFDGSAGADLNGLPPDTRPGTEVWVAGSDFDADGTVTWDSVVYGDSAYLPFVPASGYVYTLSATIQAGSEVNDSNWIAIGFTQSNSNPKARFYNDASNSPIYWMLSRTTASNLYDQDFTGPGTGGGLDFTTTSADNLKMVLDTSATTWTASWYFNGSLHRTVNVADGQKSNFNYVAISTNKANGSIDNFLLTRELGLRAANPSPAENEQGVPRDANLSWTPGKYADKHDVYFGTGFNEVNDANRTSHPGLLYYQANQDTNSYPLGTLAYGTIYYWRIDEVNDTPFAIYKGNVWSFTTEVGVGVIYYDSFDGSPGVNLHGTTPDITSGGAKWVAGFDFDADGTITYDGVEFGATAYLPFVPQDGYIYELSADLNATPGRVGGENDWIALGFTQLNSDPNSRFYNDDGERNPVYWGMSRTNLATQYDQTFIGTGPGGEGATTGGVTGATQSADHIKTVLNTVEPTWVVSWYYNGALQRTVNVTESRKSYFQYVAISTNRIHGTVDEFLLMGELQLQAWQPNPADDSMVYSTDVTLKWRPGVYADRHDVYFGTDEAKVTDANRTSHPGLLYYSENQDPNRYPVIGQLTLTYGKTYYWRIDEVNAPNIWQGEIWSFKIQPLEAYDPSPPDEANYVDPDVNLAWSPGAKAALHDVYLGTDETKVTDATRANHPGLLVFDPNEEPNSYEPGTLALGTTYYWRIDEVNSPNIWKGDVWSFTTEPNIPITDPHLIGWWKFDEGVGTKALDWSGHERDGTLVNGPMWVTGHISGALLFDGLDDHVDLPIGEDINSLTSCTFMTWVNFPNIGGVWQRIFDFGTGTTNYMYLSPRTGGGGPLQFAINSGSTQSVIAAPTTLASGWHHVAVVINGASNTMQLYRDADVVASGPTLLLPTDLGETTQNWLGRSQFAADGYFVGLLDDFRIYDYAMTAGEIEQIGAPPEAWGPYPADGDTVSGIPAPTLTWKRGKYADKVNGHELYFSSDFDDVNERTATKIVRNVPNYPIPSPLDLGRTYYWAVDEVNDACEPYLWEGIVWRFTTRDHRVVEDFNSYPNTDPNLHAVWKDYTTTPPAPGYAYVYVNTDANFVRGGNSMQYDYKDYADPYYSEAYAATAALPSGIGSNWTIGGVKALSLWFYGKAGNDANEKMYVKLQDADSNSKVWYPTEMADDVKEEQWHEWNIDLADFTGVTLTNVTRITIGFGDGSDPYPASGTGTVYFEDIRLYPPRCMPLLRKPAADFDNNCDVDYNDLEVVINNWLISDYDVTPVNPGNSNLVGWWKLDETSGTIADDSSSYGNDGDVNGNPQWIAGHINNALRFNPSDANDYVDLPIDSLISSLTNSTFATWVDFNSTSAGAWQRIFDFGKNTTVYMFLTPRMGTTTTGVMRFGITIGGSGAAEQIVDAPATLASGWHHVAVTIDADNDTIILYLDGELVGENTAATLDPNDLGVTTNNWLGRSQWAADAYFSGSLDDFRIYDRALSQEEVAYLAERSTFTQPLYLLLTPPDPNISLLYDDGIINFKDYAVLADEWLEEQLWPEP
jgi:hypothetical protein